jgi:hypothetical protein
MFYKRSTYIYISFSLLSFSIFSFLVLVPTAGIPQQLWAPPCVVATRAPARRVINCIVGQVGGWFWPDIRRGFGQIYAVFLAEIYAPAFGCFWKTRRIIQGVLFWEYNTGRIYFYEFAQCTPPHTPLPPPGTPPNSGRIAKGGNERVLE